MVPIEKWQSGYPKTFFFNRENEDYCEWLNKNDDGGLSFSSISWKRLEETLAHELAHAVVNSLFDKYGERGHGLLHDKFNWEIREMMRASNEWKEFENWWKNSN